MKKKNKQKAVGLEFFQSHNYVVILHVFELPACLKYLTNSIKRSSLLELKLLFISNM